MAGSTERRIFIQSGACAILLVLALVIPRFVPNREGGFASAATAILALLVLLLAAGLFALLPLVETVRSFRSIGPLARVAGIAPAVVLLGGLVWLVLFLRY